MEGSRRHQEVKLFVRCLQVPIELEQIFANATSGYLLHSNRHNNITNIDDPDSNVSKDHHVCY